MIWVPKDQEESDFFGELATLPDRIAGLLATTIVDDRLTEAIQAYWHDTKINGEGIFTRLFSYSGPLGNFGTRIEIGFAMGLYSDEMMKDLHIIRRIRNAFAHKIAPKDFKAQQISALTQNLKAPDKFPITATDSVSYHSSTTNPPTMLGFMQALITHSTVSDMTDPRSRFIRSVEVFSGLLFALSADRKLVKRVPEF